MCGIAGAFVLKNRKDADLKFHSKNIENILAQQAYRGPDHQAIEEIQTKDCLLILGHNRLSIVDLLAASHQPMWDLSKRYCISYNGMLYNYVELREQLKTQGVTFYTEGDTEVVLQAFIAWGNDAFKLFNGMFAIAIYDSLEEKLYLVRDRFGIKPLFYHIRGDELYFASTSAAIASQMRLQPDLNVLSKGLHYWCYDFHSDTTYQDLKMVPPSEILIFSFNASLRINCYKYYDLATQVQVIQPEKNHTKAIIERVESLLEDAVKIRLRSDVKLGVSLSGGIDSGTIASIAKHELGELSAFSFGSLKNKFSEAKLAQLTANQSGLKLHYVYPTSEEMITGFFETLNLQDAPFPNLSIVAQYFVFKQARDQGIKVMLGGQGGDEIFMGYRKYLLFYIQHLIYQKNYWQALSVLSQFIPNAFCEIKNIKTHLFNIRRYSKTTEKNRWQHNVRSTNLGSLSCDSLWKRQLRDIDALSLPTLLRYEDRNSMGNSIESRLPFLDYRLVELALSLPECLKINKGFGKWILRQISASHLPKQIAYSRVKRGFDIDTRFWIQGGLGESLRACLKNNSNMLKSMGLINKVDIIFSDHDLTTKPQILAECITLAWMSSKQYFLWS